MRLDCWLYEKGLTDSRTRAKNLIEMNRVTVDGKYVGKPSHEMTGGENVEISGDYAASLGSLKLSEAVKSFGIDVNGKVCLDVGASNGGFTDILLSAGARKVYALDIAECALPERLKNNGKVVVKDRTNARNIKKNDFDEQIDLCVADVSFISLKLILPGIYGILNAGGNAVVLVKPQFELDKKSLTKSGIVKNRSLTEKAVNGVENFSEKTGFTVAGLIAAPHPFEYKNQEYLLRLIK
jgi:23S rRNA (cytidine1920-2'-O)/16S rRNA (cytidine1409-2'-O)-methyltransferase